MCAGILGRTLTDRERTRASVAFDAADPDNGPGDRSDDLHHGHPPTTSASTPPDPHTRPVTCVLHVAQVSLTDGVRILAGLAV